LKRTELEKHLRAHGCQLYREGSKHSVWWNPANRKTSAVPRHREINSYTARGICRSLEIAEPKIS
jgi:mRNA interferase HicA